MHIPLWILLLLKGPSPSLPFEVPVPPEAAFIVCGDNAIASESRCCLSVAKGVAVFSCSNSIGHKELDAVRVVNIKADEKTASKK